MFSVSQPFSTGGHMDNAGQSRQAHNGAGLSAPQGQGGAITGGLIHQVAVVRGDDRGGAFRGEDRRTAVPANGMTLRVPHADGQQNFIARMGGRIAAGVEDQGVSGIGVTSVCAQTSRPPMKPRTVSVPGR